MIKTSLYTPEYYNTNSRDFQLFGYLYDSIFNYAKTNASMIYKIHKKTISNIFCLKLFLLLLKLPDIQPTIFAFLYLILPN